MAKSRVVRAFSAGGVVFRGAESLRSPSAGALSADVTAAPNAPTHTWGVGASSLPVDIALVGYPREGIWVLPKGTPSQGESPEQTALREVREETGLEVHILGDLGTIEYWFARRGVRFHKEVLHFLMLAVGGDVTRHDHEYDEARWFPYDEALRQLTHANEAAVVRRAEPRIHQWLTAHP